MHGRALFCGQLVFLLLSIGNAMPLDKDENKSEVDSNELYKPEGRSRNDWINCGGLDCNDWQITQRALTLLAVMETGGDVTKVLDDSLEELENETEGADIMLTPEQAEFILNQEKKRFEKKEHNTLTKRKISSLPVHLWQLPIIYKFDGDFSEHEKRVVRKALQHWQNNTCVRFTERPLAADMTENHLLFTQRLQPRCGSYIGRANLRPVFPQTINLHYSCLFQLGTPVHEIGHALGLWHEHQRPSRDEFIDIDYEALHKWAAVNYIKGPDAAVDETGIPYDFNSVMHYAATTASRTGKPTILAKDSRFQKNMGQRVGLSFLDAKVVNNAYCSDVCRNAKPLFCKRGGYQNPNNCNTCLCPPGVAGKTCAQAEPSQNADCSGTVNLAAGESVVLTSPGFNEGKHYEDNTACNWIVKAPRRRHVSIRFDDDFGVYAARQTCFHWVEVQYNSDYTKPGPRMCGTHADLRVTSVRNELLITFRSMHNAPANTKRRFSFTVTADRDENEVIPLTRAPPHVNLIPDNADNEASVSHGDSIEEEATNDVEVTESWGEWSSCAGECQCGGCATKTRYRMCNGRRCTGRRAAEQTSPCVRVCTTRDRLLIPNTTFTYRLCPSCCDGFKRVGRRCLSLS